MQKARMLPDNLQQKQRFVKCQKINKFKMVRWELIRYFGYWLPFHPWSTKHNKYDQYFHIITFCKITLWCGLIPAIKSSDLTALNSSVMIMMTGSKVQLGILEMPCAWPIICLTVFSYLLTESHIKNILVPYLCILLLLLNHRKLTGQLTRAKK